MIKKTTDYSIFRFRSDNRHEISSSHVEKIAKSIESNNLLELKPILVNENMEILDGQHRVLAAKKLNVPIFYEIREGLDQSHLIPLNLSKQWRYEDYLNFYVKNSYPEYIKLNDFVIKNSVPISVAVRLNKGGREKTKETFVTGKYVFDEERLKKTDLTNEIIDLIKSIKTSVNYLAGTRVYLSLFRIIMHENYSHEKFLSNIKRLIDKIEPKATQEGYIKMFVDIHNWRNPKRISWRDDGESDSLAEYSSKDMSGC